MYSANPETQTHGTACVIEMSANSKDEKTVSSFDAHEPDWVDVDLGPRRVNSETHHPQPVVLGQGPGWTNFDLESNAPSKKRSWLRNRNSKLVVSLAIIAMLLIATIVPAVVAVRNGEGEGIPRLI